MNATVASLLKLATSLLLVAQHGQVPPALQQKLIVLAEQSVQVSTQELATINFPVTPDTSVYPNITDVINAPYIGPSGTYVPLGQDVQIIEEDTSFGDLNADGTDDAAVVVKKTATDGTASYALGALLNQGNILFNIADLSLGSVMPQISTHAIANGTITLGGSSYVLFGNQLRALPLH